MKLTRQLDEEVQKRDQVSAESQQLERRLQDGLGLALTIAGATNAGENSGIHGEKYGEMYSI